MNQEPLQKLLSTITEVMISIAEWIKTLGNIDIGDYNTKTAIGIGIIIVTVIMNWIRYNSHR